jgi:hypothetical protein
MASFWAAGNSKIKTAESTTPFFTEAPSKPKQTTTTQQKKGLVFKSMNVVTNGYNNDATKGKSLTSSLANGSKIDWADADDDDEKCYVPTPFTKQLKDPRITTLEATVTVKEERIQELEATVVTKVLRIEELEDTVEDKEHRIGNLEAMLDEKDTQIEVQKKENNNQYLHVQELVGEVDERDRRIKNLEAEISEKSALIRDLEQKTDSGPKAPTKAAQVVGKDEVKIDVPNASTSPDVEDATSKTVEANSAASETASSNSRVVDTPQSEVDTEQTTETSTEELQQTPSTKIRDPSVCESNFPTFVTKETLKVVPPAPQPKKLSFPIDFSKYGKKSAAPSVVKKSPATPKTGSASWGHTSKQARIKTDAVPRFDPSADIRHMSHGERVVFANGPDVMVKMGEVELATMPKFILMQCSGKAYQYFTVNPEVTTWVFPADSMDVDAANAHLAWMDEMTYQGRVYSITLNTNPSLDRKNLHICRAARVMGLNNTYVGHFTKQFCDRIRNKDVSPEFLNMVCDMAYPGNDPIFECLANNLVNQKLGGGLQDTAVLDKLVAKHPLLKEKMAVIEKRINNKLMAMSREASKDRSGGNGRRDGTVGNGGRDRTGAAAGGAQFTTVR